VPVYGPYIRPFNGLLAASKQAFSKLKTTWRYPHFFWVRKIFGGENFWPEIQKKNGFFPDPLQPNKYGQSIFLLDKAQILARSPAAGRPARYQGALNG
jgi:hypothetical protein